MRLIDADKCLDDIIELQKSPWYNDSPFESYAKSLELAVRKDAVYMVRDLVIKRAKTIDPVKHGHWVENPIGCSCSVCGELHRYDVLTANMTHLYCNHCGAKMDKEIKE